MVKTSCRGSGCPSPRSLSGCEVGIGKEGTEELAVMMDTFRPLKLTVAARPFDDERYPFSWLEGSGGTPAFEGSDSMG